MGIASRLHQRLPPHLEHQDLVASGMVGLLGAIDRYDPERSSTFAAYAAPRVLGAIIDWLRKNDFLPRAARQRGVSVQFLSLEEPVSRPGVEQEQCASPLETIADEQARDPEETVVKQETVRAALGVLPKRERQIVVLHCLADLPLTAVAELIGATPRRTGALHARAMARLQRLLRDPSELAAEGPYVTDMAAANGAVNDPPTASAEIAVVEARDALTLPELEVLRAAAEGMSAEETARQLTKSAGTVRTQRKRVLAKLRARNMAQAVWLASRKGYLRPA